MTPQQANKAVGEDPCNSCPEYRPRKVCAKRPGCKAWERYCFRRKVVAAARQKERQNIYALNRGRYTCKVRKLRQEATGRRVRTI